MTGETSQSPDENAQPRRLRDRAWSAAPHAVSALAGGALVVAVVLISGRSQREPGQLPQMNSLRSPTGPGVRVARSLVSPSESVRRPTHVVRSHPRGDVHVHGYVRPRVRRGHESLTASQLAELIARG